jgi:pyruvate/2-oxoglutarate dehydrogenase complex dihydrolipoamide dehydrogenase (E3) component
MTMQNFYDLAVIGAGPAGIVGATTAASLGAKVVLIDRYGDLGGAGANTGTVPSRLCAKRRSRSRASARVISTASIFHCAAKQRSPT